MFESSKQEIFFKEEIARVQEYLESLLKAQAAYENLKPKAAITNKMIGADQEPIEILVSQNAMLPTILVDEVLSEMQPDRIFENNEIFDILFQKKGIDYKQNKNAATILSCLLSRRVKDGQLEKIGRGKFKKIKGSALSPN